MDKCEKCGMDLTDECMVVWKCQECGKAFKVSFSKLHKIQEWKRKNAGKHFIKCSSCGCPLDDGNEKIACKCSACGKVLGGNLAYFAGSKKCVNNDREINTGSLDSDMMKCPECGMKILSNSKLCSYCGYLLEEKPITKSLHSKKYLIIIVAAGIFLLVTLCMLFRAHQKPDTEVQLDEGTKSVLESLDMIMPDEREMVESRVDDFLTNLKNGNWEETQEYLTEKYDYMDHNPFGLSTESNLKKLFEKYRYTLIDSTVNDEKDTAYVNLEIIHPNPVELLEAGIGGPFGILSEGSLEKGFMDKLEDPSQKMDTTTGSLHLIKVDGEWKIETDELFYTCIYYGISEETSFDKLADNRKRHAEEELYIREMIDLVDYQIDMMEGYSGRVPGINNISIKNNGDKQIDSLTLGLDFYDENGEVLFSKEILVLGMFDDPISAGYSWKMEKDKFLKIENISDDIDLSMAAASIKDVQLSDPKIVTQKTPEEEYIDQYIEITDYHVSMKSGYKGKEPGLSDVSIKNNGDRNISELTLTVYFQDENGKNIAEDSFMLIGGFWGGDTLKANYSWKMENNKYYEFCNLADEVELSRNRVKVTEITFE